MSDSEQQPKSVINGCNGLVYDIRTKTDDEKSQYYMNRLSGFAMEAIGRVRELENKLSDANFIIEKHAADLVFVEDKWTEIYAKQRQQIAALTAEVSMLKLHDSEDDAMIKKLDLSNIALRGVITRMQSKRRRRK